MRYNHSLTSLIGLALLTACISSCGTSKRTLKSPGSTSTRAHDLSIDSTYTDYTTTDSAALHAPVLITRDGKDVKAVKLIEKGRASWYGPKFNGRLTANGEQYDMDGLTAAHRTLPFNTLVLVKNMNNGATTLVRINDRGPFAKNRIIDLSKKAASQIDMIGTGTAPVKLYVEKNAFKKSKPRNLKVATYTIQMGSFKTEARAFTYSSRIVGSRVEVIRKKDQTIYRVYYGLYINRDKATRVQRKLEKRNFSGYVKQLENG